MGITPSRRTRKKTSCYLAKTPVRIVQPPEQLCFPSTAAITMAKRLDEQTQREIEAASRRIDRSEQERKEAEAAELQREFERSERLERMAARQAERDKQKNREAWRAGGFIIGCLIFVSTAVWIGQQLPPPNPELEHQRMIKREADRRDEAERQAIEEIVKEGEIEAYRKLRKN